MQGRSWRAIQRPRFRIYGTERKVDIIIHPAIVRTHIAGGVRRSIRGTHIDEIIFFSLVAHDVNGIADDGDYQINDHESRDHEEGDEGNPSPEAIELNLLQNYRPLILRHK